MRLQGIRLTNFRQHASTAIEFGTGLTGIIGPNGTGKTTILEGIAWALYGNDAARGRRESIRFLRADAKAPVRVELDFELAGHNYRVVRGLTSAELYLDGGAHPVANSITSVGSMLQARLGMSRAEFFNTYFTGQKELSVMTSLGPTERGQFLSRVLGYERLRDAQELARNRRRELLSELNGLRQAMPDVEAVTRALADADTRVRDATARAQAAVELRERAQLDLSTIAPKWETAQRDRALQQQVAADLRVAELDLTSRARELEHAVARVTEVESAVRDLAKITPELAPLPSLTAEREALDLLAREEGRRQTLVDAVKAADDELAQLAARHTHLEGSPREVEEVTARLDAKRKELQQTDERLEAERTALARDRQQAETRRDELLRQHSDIKKQRDRIVEAGEDGICPTCQRPLGANFRTMLDTLDAQLDAVRVDGTYFKSRIEQLKATPAALVELEERHRVLSREATGLERGIATVQAAVRELAEVARSAVRQEQRLAGLRAEIATLPPGYDAARHDTVRREIERLTPLAQRASRLLVLADRGDAARADVAGAQSARNDASARLEVLRKKAGANAADDKAFEAVRAAHERATRASREADVALAKAEAEAGAASEARDRARAARDELARSEVRLNDLTRDRRLHDELDHAYTDLRTDLNFALRPEISALASEFLADLTDGRYTELDLDDQYDLVIVEDGTPKPVVSGGEEDLANLVLRLAISQMIADRAGHAFSLLVLDEVFGSLDESRRQNVVELMRRLHDRFEQIILITHIESVRDGCDHVLTVRYDAATGAAAVDAAEPPAASDQLLALEKAS